ncbi:hypothetical protein RBE51_30160 [Pseudomonas taiwanensis]|uniref:hypothetical protein n=1 Tax=Pseudomonas taiwanensis TaxID=470150 RepID=UPI0028DF6556|nr:hypothetical protein [Pseudomonas taiwanensis]MDT8927060.1 hypothetical protein [Pseudomonas taiwanensis]
MNKRIVWKVGDFLVLQVRDGLYTVANMVGKTVLCVFDVFRTEDEWSDVDWRKVRPLFQVFVGSVVQKKLGVRKFSVEGWGTDIVVPQRYWIKPYSVADGDHFKGGGDKFSFYGGKLIDVGVGDNPETYGAPVIKHDLSVRDDRDIIEAHELTNMWGDQDLSDRLSRYYDAGINRDDLKFEIFPGLWDDREQLRPLTRRLPIPLR